MTEDLPQTIGGVVTRAAERYGDAEAFVDGDVRLSWVELDREVDRAAKAFLGWGLQAGDRVAIWGPNCLEWALAELGLHRAGGVLVPLNTRFKGREAGYILGKARARLLFTVTDFLDTDYVALLDGIETDTVEETVILRGTVPEGTTSWEAFLARGDDVDDHALAERAAGIRGDDLSDILFTSGTTGSPKGAMLRHAAGIKAYDAWSSVVGLREGDRYLIINPFFHAFGLKAGILASLIKGATILPQPVFDVPAVMERVPRDRISMLPGPPAVYQTILNHPDRERFDMSSLRLAVTGAAPIPVELVTRMKDELGFETVVTGYGLTEAHGIATMCRHDDDPATIANTDGRAIPDVEVLVVDEDGNEVPRGEPGEVVVRGYNVMSGYFEDPEQTAEAIDADGWLHTGDIAVMDERGYLDITDRKKDMFIQGGFNAYPAEIESLLLEHPDIAQVAVIGVPDDRLGEVGMAFVVPASGSSPEESDLIAWAREHMANYKAPRYVELVEALPMNASNKVLKTELRMRAEERLVG
ncbi:MAG TPA: FadD3 family acyl-CoA ligase [Acidimicrobiales bacterium]|nr:FadD3 family acyl-CoA ligase [Acidimicrobiales bacterium]